MSDHARVDAIITYGWNRIAYNALRSLTAQGLTVAVGDASASAMSFKSKFCQRHFVYPNFYQAPALFIDCLKERFAKLRPAVYLPMHEETFVVAKYRQALADWPVKIPIHDFATLRAVHKKDSFAQIISNLNLPMPRTVKPTSQDQLSDVWQELSRSGKVVIKMVNTNSAKGIHYASSPHELEQLFTALVAKHCLLPENYPIIQEYVQGIGYGVSMLFNRGELRARFSHKRLREKTVTGGTSTKRISVKNPLLEEYAEFILKSLHWHGVAMVEFKYDEATNQAWIIEINPRFWGSLALAIQSGVNFPYLLYRMAVDGDVAPVLDYQAGVISRWLLGDMLATFNYAKQQKSLKPIGEFLHFRGEKFDDYYNDDRRAFFAETAYYLKKLLKTASFNPQENALLDIDKI